MLRTALPWAAPLALLASGLDVLPPLVPGAGRPGLQWASVFAAVIMLAGLGRAIQDAKIRRRMGPLTLAVCTLVAAGLLSAVWAEKPMVAGLWALRIGLVGGVILGLLARDPGGRDIRRIVAGGAAAVIISWAVLWCVGVALPSGRSLIFEIGSHQHIGPLSRLRGLNLSPTTSGQTLLVAVAMVQALEGGRIRHALSAAGLALATLSWSIVTLAVPLALILGYVPSKRLRRRMAAGWIVASLAVLYVNPVSVSGGETTYETGRLHPSYHATGLGPIHTPLRALSIGPFTLTYHRSHYWQCVEANVTCATRHPVVGVGGLNFQIACPVTTMDSYGTWVTGRRTHNQYLGLLSQHGLLGLMAALLILLVFTRRTRWTPTNSLERGLLWAYLFCGLQGDVVYQFPFAIWMGASLQFRGFRRTSEP